MRPGLTRPGPGAGRAATGGRSILVAGEDLAPASGAHEPPRLKADGVLDEVHRAVHERDIHAAGVITRRIHGAVPFTAAEGVRPIGVDRRRVRGEQMSVDVFLPGIGVGSGMPLEDAPSLPVDRPGQSVLDGSQGRHVHCLERVDESGVGVIQVTPPVRGIL